MFIEDVFDDVGRLVIRLIIDLGSYCIRNKGTCSAEVAERLGTETSVLAVERDNNPS
jgi:hypothetical protein